MPAKRHNPPSKAMPCLSQAQVQTLLTHVKDRADQARSAGSSRPIVDELIVLLLLHAGLRPGELRSLRIADTPACHGKPELHIRRGRGASARVVHIPQDLAQMLERFVRLYRTHARTTDLLLYSEQGNPFGYISLYSKIRRIGGEAGIGALHPAMLRNTFLVRLYESEHDLRLVQLQAGHAAIRTTARHVRPRHPASPCDACGKPMPPGAGQAIDSGQLLCPACLKDLRSH